MKRRAFGPTGEQVPILGQGTWAMEKNPDASIRALRRGLDLGLTHIDTAEMYGDGRVEEIVGQAIAGRRQEVFLVSKVLPSNASRRGTVEACERSLRRLGTDHLDVYLLHWPGSHPLEDTVAAFDELRQAGKIRHWGVSNFDEKQLADVVEIAGKGGGGGEGSSPVVTNQVLYHLEERAIEHKVLPYCAEHDIALVGYSPLGSGDFPAGESAGGRALAELAGEHGTTPQGIALAFLLRHPAVFLIPKASREEHVEANARAAEIELTAEELARIDKAFPRKPWRGGVPVL